MRRAAVQAFRSTRQIHPGPLRKIVTPRVPLSPSAFRSLSTKASSSPFNPRNHVPKHIIHSSMYIRNFSLTLCASVLASGLWIYHRDGYSGIKPFANSKSSATPQAFPSTQYSTAASNSLSTISPLRPSSTTLLEPDQDRPSLVEEGDSYLSDSAEDAALYKQTEEQDYHMGTLTPEQATQKLRRAEESYLIARGNGVVRYDLVQLASNNPIEDDHAEKIVSVDKSITPAPEGSERSDWMFWGVFDGHSGWTTSARLRQALISYVARELNSTYKSAIQSAPAALPPPQAIDAAIKRGFLSLDHELVNKSLEKTLSTSTKRTSTELLAPALSGSCALLSFYDSSSKLLRVACTGDSRAILGRKNSAGKWTATALSEDQTGGTPSEMARLRAAHPGEDYVVHRGRILGQLEPSRAFGDASYKWSREMQEKVKKFFFGRSVNPLLKTPPYVTAEPVVTTTKVEPEKGDFVVLATDGLWEMLTNEEVVGLVGRWLEKEEKGPSQSGWMTSLFGGTSDKNLPVERPEKDANTDEKNGQRPPIRQAQYDIKSTDERFVVEDKNAATHLVRNALGGRDSDLVCALLSLISPTSRRYRDDLTVEVIFFGDGDKTGDVAVNTEASGPVKPRL